MTKDEAKGKIDLLMEMTNLLLEYRKLLEETFQELQAADLNLSFWEQSLLEKEQQIQNVRNDLWLQCQTLQFSQSRND